MPNAKMALDVHASQCQFVRNDLAMEILNMQKHKRLVGILGGMGPAATIDFMSKIIAATPAEVDQDHVPLIIHDVPQIPDRSTAIEVGSDDPFLPMLSGVRMLDAAGVEYIAIPCNTAHFWHNRLQLGCRAQILHIGDAVAMSLQAMDYKPKSIAVMATRGTIASGIYTNRLQGVIEKNIVPTSEAQRLIDLAIAAVKGSDLSMAFPAAKEAVKHLRAQGAQSVLLACTELPVVLSGVEIDGMVMIDATEALARACVQASLGNIEMAIAV